jgi:hypothetical protein
MIKNNTTFNKKEKYWFDLDGVICKTYLGSYKKYKPIFKSIKKINSLYTEGNEIMIFTSRFMGSNKNNVYLAKKQGYHFSFKQLTKWKVKLHKLIFWKTFFRFHSG